MEGLTTSQVAELLKKEGLRDDVVQLFVENEVDGKALMMLETEEDYTMYMKELGLTKVGDKLKIKNLIRKYKEDAKSKEIPPADHHERESVRKCVQFTMYDENFICTLPGCFFTV